MTRIARIKFFDQCHQRLPAVRFGLTNYGDYGDLGDRFNRHFIALHQQHSYTLSRAHPSSRYFRRVVFSSYALSRGHTDPKRVLTVRAALRYGIQSAAESLFAVLFPSDCRICQGPLTGISNLPVCEECLGKIAPLEGLLCRVCGEKLFSSYTQTQDGPLCGLCRR